MKLSVGLYGIMLCPAPLSALVLEGNMAENWMRYKWELSTCIDGYFDKVSGKKKVAIIFHHAGNEAREVFESFQLSNEDKENLEKVLVLTNILFHKQM